MAIAVFSPLVYILIQLLVIEHAIAAPSSESAGVNLFNGDIVISPKTTRNGILAAKRWTNGVIPWEFTTDVNWGQKHKDMLAQVMLEVEQHTCIKFVPRTTEPNYVRIVNSSFSTGCYSSVGQERGLQSLSLYDSEGISCWTHHTVTHELFHTIGLWHEQERYDRDNYIKVYLNNVSPVMKYNFIAKPQNESYTYGVPYDYYSVMHYGKRVFSKNDRTTIKTLDLKMMDVIGNQKTASENDYEKIRRIYECKGSYPSMPPNSAPPPTSPADLHICEDEIDYCNQQLNQCGQDWTKTYCKRSCGFCTRDDDCQDEWTYCDELAKRGDCATYVVVRELYCRRTCKFC